jgi:hypothetical protein
MMVKVKDELHRLIDALPESELHAARRYLEYLRHVGEDPMLRAFLQAPESDEPLTEEDLRAIKEAEQAIARGDVRPWQEVRAELLASERRSSPSRRRHRRV